MNRKRQQFADIQAPHQEEIGVRSEERLSLLHKMQGNIQRNTQRIRVRRIKVWST